MSHDDSIGLAVSSPMRSARNQRKTCQVLAILLVVSVGMLSSALPAQDEPHQPTSTTIVDGIRVPEGFHVELYADDDLAHDIHSMTFDSKGRVVVSGPGYVRILIDSNNDGRAESFKQFADKPDTGSQGMFFLGSSLLCSGDQWLQWHTRQ